jgi:hypothetical protein
VPASCGYGPQIAGCSLLITGRCRRTGRWRAAHRERGHRLATQRTAPPCAQAAVPCLASTSWPRAAGMQTLCARCGEG